MGETTDDRAIRRNRGGPQDRSPYGVWLTADGRELLFDRRYRPLLERQPGRPATAADPLEWVAAIVEERWLYSDADSPKSAAPGAAAARRRCAAALAAFEAGDPLDPKLFVAGRSVPRDHQ